MHALIDRLEAAESEALEQARLNGIGSEREAALMAKLEAAEKERDALRAKIAEMEQQEPIDLRFPSALRKMWASYEIQKWIEEQGPLYALPGVKGEEK